MNTHQKVLLYTPSIAGLILGLGWYALDPKGDARGHIVDRLVRLLNHLRL